jgi:plastocyanin
VASVARSVRVALAPALLTAAALPALAGCGGTASSSTSSALISTASGASSSAPAGTAGATGSGDTSATQGTSTGAGSVISIGVKGTTVTPAPGTIDVRAGDQVTLVITADRSSEVHVHVVNIEKPITAGTPLRVTFTPTQTGVYEVEIHDPDLLLTKIAVR